MKVFERDKYTCRSCGQWGGKLEPTFRALIDDDIPDDITTQVLGDIVATSPLLIDGGANVDNILPGGDVDRTFSIPDAAADGSTKGQLHIQQGISPLLLVSYLQIKAIFIMGILKKHLMR